MTKIESEKMVTEITTAEKIEMTTISAIRLPSKGPRKM